MTLPATIGASTYAALACTQTTVVTEPANEAAWIALFATVGDYHQINNIREFPDNIGNPPNIVKVPEFGRASSLSIGAQSDSPDLELTLNYIAADWAEGGALHTLLTNKTPVAFQLSLLYAPVTNLTTTPAGLGAVANANFYFLGKMESLMVAPSLSDAVTATLALTQQSDLMGPWTINPI